MSQKPDPVLDIGLTGRKKVLVAEDEQNIASLLEDWLSESFEVILAHNGASAFQKAKWNKPDVMLLDVMMPDMGGYEVVCALQGDGATAKIPVIVMTAKNFDDSTIKLIKAEPNVFGFLNKPFKPDELKKQIMQVMSGQRTFAATTSRRPAGAPVAPSPAPPAPAAVPPPPPPTPAAVVPPAPMPIPQMAAAPAAPPLVPPTPAVVVPAAPMPIPQMASSAPVQLEVNHGFPEIVPTSAVPAAPAPAPLPPFLKPAHMPPPPAPKPPAAKIPSPPPPPALPPPPVPPQPKVAVAPAPNPLIEPISAVPPEPTEAPAPLPPLEIPVPAAAPSPVPPSAPVRPAPGKPKLASRAPADDDTGAGAGSVMMLKIAWWAFKAAAKMTIFFVGVFMAAETSCRWTEQAFGRDVFVPPLRPSRSADIPYLLPAGDSWSQGGVEYAINEWALRDGRMDLLKPAGTVRILVLGGSVAFGADMPVERTVAGQLRELLKQEKSRPDYQVVNAAVWGYSPEEQWAFYANELAQLKPDVVVWLCEDRVGGIPSSAKLKKLSQDSWLASSAFKDSHFVRLLMQRQLNEGASARPTDFLALIQPAEKAARENESKFLYAVLADRELSREEREELPEGPRVEVDETLRRDFFARTSSAQKAIAELLRDRLLSLKLSSAGKSGS